MKPRRSPICLGLESWDWCNKNVPFPHRFQWISESASLCTHYMQMFGFFTVSWFIRTFFTDLKFFKILVLADSSATLNFKPLPWKVATKEALEAEEPWNGLRDGPGCHSKRWKEQLTSGRLIFRSWVRNGKKHAKNSECVEWCWWCSSELRKWDVELWWITKKAIFPTPCPMKHRSVRNKSRLSCCASHHTAFWTLVGRQIIDQKLIGHMLFW